MKSWLVSVVALVIGIVLAEVLLRIVFSSNTMLSNRVVHRFGPDGERVGWLYERRSTIGPNRIFVDDPDIGWVSHPGTWQGDGWTANVLDGGVRAPGPRSKVRTPGKIRLVAVGDSFGFGWDQSDDRTWQAELLRRLPMLEIANLSVCGHDTGQTLLRYRRDGRAWNPDIVLLAYNKLLIGRTVEQFTMYQRPIIQAERDLFEPVGVPVPDQVTMETKLLWQPHLLLLLGMVGYTLGGLSESRFSLAEVRSQALLERFVEEVKADGRVPVVAWFTVPYEVQEAAKGGPHDIRCPKDRSVACIDLTDALLSVWRTGQPIEKGAHWSDPVAKEVAKALEKAFRERGIVSNAEAEKK